MFASKPVAAAPSVPAPFTAPPTREGPYRSEADWTTNSHGKTSSPRKDINGGIVLLDLSLALTPGHLLRLFTNKPS